MNKVLHSKFGTAKINNNGYYQITSRKEGNHKKYLHRLIYEDFWGVELPQQISIHHINGKKLDNCILNLEAMNKSEHNSLHHNGTTLSKKNCKEISKSRNTTGFFRVDKQKDVKCKQGFIWRYRYYDSAGNQKAISSVNLNKLKQKVLNKGLDWFIIDEDKAKHSYEGY